MVERAKPNLQDIADKVASHDKLIMTTDFAIKEVTDIMTRIVSIAEMEAATTVEEISDVV